MAKISAHGEKEHLRFEGPGGATVVLTKKKTGAPGRLLHKLGTNFGYAVVRTHRGARTLSEAETDARTYASARNYR